MANPSKSAAFLGGANDKPMINVTQQAKLADVALAGVDTGVDMTAAQAAALVTAINGILDILEAHGLMADA